MGIPNKQIGWGAADNLLWNISKQLERLIHVSSSSSPIPSLPYKTLVFRISNAGANNPTISVFENTLGVAFTSERIATGGYRLNFSENVPTDIMVSVSPPLLSEDDTDFSTVAWQSTSTEFIIGHYDLNRVLADNIYRTIEIKFYE